MGRAPCCDKANVKKGPWSPEEDSKLKEYIEKYGTGGNWIALPQKASLKRCGKSCRLRWLNYLRPNIKHGEFTDEEDRIICSLYYNIGSRWSIIAAQLPGRTDNDIKNYWNTKLKKKLAMGANNNHHPLRTKPSPLSPQTANIVSSQPPFNNFYQQNQIRSSFSGFDHTSSPLYQFSLMNSPNLFHSVNFSDNLMGGGGSNMLVFGGNEQASCSSNSDASYSTTTGREIKQENQFQQILGFQHHDQDGSKFILNNFCNNNINNNNNLCMDYELEDVKQLINSGGSNMMSLLLNLDENKTQQEVMYFYNN